MRLRIIREFFVAVVLLTLLGGGFIGLVWLRLHERPRPELVQRERRDDRVWEVIIPTKEEVVIVKCKRGFAYSYTRKGEVAVTCDERK